MNKLFTLLALILGICIFSCKNEALSPLRKKQGVVQPQFSAAEYLAKDSIGVYRGAEFGDEEETIRLMENDTFLVFDSPALLKYEYALPGGRKHGLSYTFKKNGLSSLTVDLFLVNPYEADNLMTEFRQWFRKKYGDEINEMGVMVWQIPTDTHKEAFLELRDESAEFGYGKVNITAYAIPK